MALSAVLLEGRGQIGRDVAGVATLDVAPFQHEYESPVLEQRDLRRGGRITGEVAARAGRRVGVLSREYGDQARRTTLLLNGERGGGPCIAGGTTTHRVHDDQCRGTLVAEHSVYVIGRSRGRPAHPYRFSRLESAEAAGGTFQYPDKDSYDPERVFAESFGIFVDERFPVENIAVTLAPRWATFVRSHRWHRSQESFVRAGRVHLRLRVRVCPELVSWILGFGPDVRVLEPQSLRRRVARLSREMEKAHRT